MKKKEETSKSFAESIGNKELMRYDSMTVEELASEINEIYCDVDLKIYEIAEYARERGINVLINKGEALYNRLINQYPLLGIHPSARSISFNNIPEPNDIAGLLKDYRRLIYLFLEKLEGVYVGSKSIKIESGYSYEVFGKKFLEYFVGSAGEITKEYSNEKILIQFVNPWQFSVVEKITNFKEESNTEELLNAFDKKFLDVVKKYTKKGYSIEHILYDAIYYISKELYFGENFRYNQYLLKKKKQELLKKYNKLLSIE